MPQHFSSHAKACCGSLPADLLHCCTQALQLANSGLVTSEQLPSLPEPEVHCAYCRHLSPIWYSMVQASGTWFPHARSRPWQLVNPHAVLTGFPGDTGVVPRVTFALPLCEAEVQPATSRVTAKTTIKAETLRTGCFMGVTSVVRTSFLALFMDLSDCENFCRITKHKYYPVYSQEPASNTSRYPNRLIPAGKIPGI